jgi:polyferredoxin
LYNHFKNIHLENPVAKNNKKTTPQADQPAPNKRNTKPSNQGWISMRTGMIALSIVSLAMTAWAAYVFIPSIGLWEGLLWAIIAGGSLWLIFLVTLLFHRFMRRGSSR